MLEPADRHDVVPDVQQRDLVPGRATSCASPGTRGRSSSAPSRAWTRSRRSEELVAVVAGAVDGVVRSRRSAAPPPRSRRARPRACRHGSPSRTRGCGPTPAIRHPPPRGSRPGPRRSCPGPRSVGADEDRDLAEVLVLVHQLMGLGDAVEAHRPPQHRADLALVDQLVGLACTPRRWRSASRGSPSGASTGSARRSRACSPTSRRR